MSQRSNIWTDKLGNFIKIDTFNDIAQIIFYFGLFSKTYISCSCNLKIVHLRRWELL